MIPVLRPSVIVGSLCSFLSWTIWWFNLDVTSHWSHLARLTQKLHLTNACHIWHTCQTVKYFTNITSDTFHMFLKRHICQTCHLSHSTSHEHFDAFYCLFNLKSTFVLHWSIWFQRLLGGNIDKKTSGLLAIDWLAKQASEADRRAAGVAQPYLWALLCLHFAVLFYPALFYSAFTLLCWSALLVSAFLCFSLVISAVQPTIRYCSSAQALICASDTGFIFVKSIAIGSK